MAKIPTGNFGNMVAQGSPGARLNPAAFDTGSGLADAGQSFMRIAAGEVYQQRQEQKQIAYERDQLIREAARKAEQEDAALKKARSANTLLDYEMQVDATSKNIEQQVNSGQLKYSDALPTYQKALEKIGMPDMTGYDPVDQENLSRGIRRLGFKGQDSMYKLQETGRVAELKSQTDSVMDTLGKKAGLPGADMALLTKQADAMDAVGQQAYGAAWGKKKQDWIDNTWDAHLNQQAMSVGSNVQGIRQLKKEITTGVYADKLDSNRRNTLVAKLDGLETGLIQRNEAAAQRVQRQQEKRMNDARSAFETYQTLADKGLYLSPEYVNQVTQQTAGTPYQQGVIALNKQAQETGGLAAQPINAQKQILTQIDAQIAKSGRTPELDKRREQVSKVLTASQGDLQNNGIRAGLKRGVITQIEPLDTSSTDNMITSISKRVQSAETVSMWAGKPVSPLDSEEAGQVRAMLEVLPPKEKAQAIANITQAVGSRSSGAIAQQLDKQNRPLALAFASASSKTTADRYTSELILKGDQAIKDGVVMKDDKKITGTKAVIAAQIDGLFPNEQISGAVKDAAYYIASGFAKESGGIVGDDEIRKAVNLAIGGSIIERNGQRLPVPAGIDEGAFNTRISSVSANELKQQAPDGQVRVGGVLVNVSDFSKSIPGQELQFAGRGRYWVMVGGRPVTNTNGQRIVIKVQP